MPHSCGNVGTSRIPGWENRRDWDLSRGADRAGVWGAQVFGAPLTGIGLSPHTPTSDYGTLGPH